MHWQEIQKQLSKLEEEALKLRKELLLLQKKCSHSKLPKRRLDESYYDTCPDCGFLRCYYEV